MKKRTLIMGMGLGLALSLAFAPSLPAATTVINTQKIVRSGVQPTPVTMITATANALTLTAGELIRIVNADATNAITVTMVDQRVNREGYTTNATVIVPASGVRYAGPWIKSRWADGSGLLQMTMTGTTQSASVEAVRLPFGEPESQTK